jgi:hypothetical protein
MLAIYELPLAEPRVKLFHECLIDPALQGFIQGRFFKAPLQDYIVFGSQNEPTIFKIVTITLITKSDANNRAISIKDFNFGSIFDLHL